MTEPKRPSESNSGSPTGHYTTGDLRKHAEDALRRLREKNVLPPVSVPTPRQPETETIETVDVPGNTTYDLGREAQRAIQQSPQTPMTNVPNGTQEFTDTMVLRFDVSEATN